MALLAFCACKELDDRTRQFRSGVQDHRKQQIRLTFRRLILHAKIALSCYPPALCCTCMLVMLGDECVPDVSGFASTYQYQYDCFSDGELLIL
jgi:hypothetical protein